MLCEKLCKYPKNFKLPFKARLNQVQFNSVENSRTNIFLPEIIENYLFDYLLDSELWPKKRVKYGYSIFFKQK